ncbi:hypothetical protein LI168_07805 [Desulfovibrio desulfuricans]|uniref:hypothetical protein n=1 Tax=Desulfovibrio desulfuricans TaxID=876 RepID=UPI001D06FC06|nr:hypothetical protein [Desulfovibrio desulfuricans]MCB6542099.1 hypothetical protein [Desulfovibrio desulfuricans]MCB6553121.1 hypothetical protein [Desulfovibrio desulfuricans]MCB6565084.1 hypothetical protein [Desulfovibrio desulfuricans]MCB7346146.1 hypothetical protein [Desulfovibrio desulfuricans]MCQ5218532.1 hypothetical protein [Desulfovibrio desulfuricans]
MEHAGRAEGLRALIRQGLQTVSQQNTIAHLGDRSTYVGMSDIGRHWECPRAALARKALPTTNSLERLLILQRGHWFESGVGQALASLGLHVLPQLEITWQHQSVPIKAHLDFVLVWGTPVNAIRILEVKSTDRLPDSPYDSHLLQLHGQIGLLTKAWSKPVFSLRAEDGTLLHEKMTFPQLCHARFGLQLPTSAGGVSLEAWLLCLSMKKVQAFGPYGFNQAMLDTALDHAMQLWGDLTAYRAGKLPLVQVDCAQGFYPLCSYCEFNSDCPKFPQGTHLPQWEPALDKLAALKERRTVLDNEIKEMETVLKLAHRQAGTRDWVNTGKYRFRASVTAGRNILNREALHAELTGIFRVEQLDDIDVDALLTRCERTGAPSERLSIAPINIGNAMMT